MSAPARPPQGYSDLPSPATISVYVPTALRDYCRGAAHFPMAAPDVRLLLLELERHYPKLHRNICDETGALRRHINVFVNDSSARDLQGLDTALAAGNVVSILTAVSGG